MSCCDYNNDGIPDGVDDGWEGVVYGCNVLNCLNYDPVANVNDGSCCSCDENSWQWNYLPPECGVQCDKIPHAECRPGQLWGWHDGGCRCYDAFINIPITDRQQSTQRKSEKQLLIDEIKRKQKSK